MASSLLFLLLFPLFFSLAFSQFFSFFSGQDPEPVPQAAFFTGFLGSWELVVPDAGVSAMHMQLMPGTSKAVIFDSTIFGPSHIGLPDGKCRYDPHNKVTHQDCWAHSIEYDYDTGAIRPLMVLTDTWCSSGALSIDGRLVQTGGFNDGGRVVRSYSTCDSCDWQEFPLTLTGQRWYASNHILPDGRIIVVGGRRKFDYEFVPAAGERNVEAFRLPFLREATDAWENTLYPFVFLSTDGNLFIFANNRAILLDYQANRIVKTFPDLPGGARNYPGSGSAVLLPLNLEDDRRPLPAEVLVCGGSHPEASELAARGVFQPALDTCGRIQITDPDPVWNIETMPSGRVMGDMLILPNAEVLLMNGARSGSAGWGFAQDPILEPVKYTPWNPVGSRFQVLNPTKIPRVYHSSSAVLPDGRVLVAGSNTNNDYNFTAQFPTELRMEKFSPPYLDPSMSIHRPTIISDAAPREIQYGQTFTVRVFLMDLLAGSAEFMVTMYRPPFTTHSFSQNQRMLVLNIQGVQENLLPLGTYEIAATAPPDNVVAPPGHYLLFVVHSGLPSAGIWVHIQ
ncbi:WSC domain-containing protein [Nymphaea thermarum]|nr:WSC domain-containing protein [Nymphaea thermarum]